MKGEERCFFDPAAGRRPLTWAEEEAARRAAEFRAEAAESRAERETAARRAAEARAAALEALLHENRSSPGSR